MFSAAAAETHTFSRVKRNGYDPHEVDAVVARLIADLKQAQSTIAALSSADDATKETARPMAALEPPEIRHLVDALS